MFTSQSMSKLSAICGTAVVGSIVGLATFEAGTAHAMSFTQSITRTETELFRGNNTFPANDFFFDIPQLTSNSLQFTISWLNLDVDGFSLRDEDFDVFFRDQRDNVSQIFNEIDSNLGGDVSNSNGSYTRALNLPSLEAGSLGFRVNVDGFFGNGVNPNPPEGSMTLAIAGEAVPTPALLPGLVGMGVAAIRKKKQAGEEIQAT